MCLFDGACGLNTLTSNIDIISSANIPAELHEVVSPFTRPSFLFSLPNFPTGCGRGGSGDETMIHRGVASKWHHNKNWL